MDNTSPNDIPEANAGQTAARVAWVAGVFSVVVCLLLLNDYRQRRVDDPLEAPEYLALKEKLATEPQNEELKTEIRRLDLALRETYFRQRRFTHLGAFLLILGLVVFLLAAQQAARARRRLPHPSPLVGPRDTELRTAQFGRRAVAVLALIVVGTGVGLSFGIKTPLTEKDAENLAQKDPGKTDEAPTVDISGFPTDEDLQKNWSRFRGPGGRGIARYENIPTTWNGASGEGVLWKTSVPLPGNSSPIVWGDRVFFSGATKTERKVFCFDADSGELLWRQETPSTPQSAAPPPKVMDATGYAAPTMATNGRGVFVIFANGDLAAFDLEGNLAWSRSFGIPKNAYGHASSLAMVRDRLIVQLDQASTKDGKSRLYALDAATGKNVWAVKREVPNSWTSPIVIEHDGRTQIVTSADPWVIAYSPENGAELWRAKVMQQDVGPSPTFAGGTVFVANEFPALAAIRADGTGDVTDTHVLWRGEDGLPDTSSPLATDEFVFLLASYGILTCYDAKTGELLWEKEFEATFSSSPTLIGGRLYLFGEEGKAWIVEPTREKGNLVAQADLGEDCVTSPAVVDGRLYIRGKKHLFCIGAK